VIAVYAIGGGAGHVTRARRVIDALGIRNTAFIVATPSDPRAADGIPLVEVPRSLEGDVAAHRAWLQGIECERMIVDVFPAGIQGELSRFDRVPLDFVGRLLRLDEYRRATNDAEWPQFETAYVVEEGAPDVQAKKVVRLELAQQSGVHCVTVDGVTLSREGERGAKGLLANRQFCAQRPFAPQPPSLLRVTPSLASLDATPPLPSQPLASQRLASARGSFWLIVHSGPANEVEELMAYTRELTTARVLVATPCDIPMPQGFVRIDAFPVSHLYADAERIVSAAGFNVMLETEPWRDKHIVLPFPRRFDDQFARAARRKSASAKF
jgi:hypothetical protein